MSDEDFDDDFVAEQTPNDEPSRFGFTFNQPENEGSTEVQSNKNLAASKTQQRENDENRWRDMLINMSGVRQPFRPEYQDEDAENETKICITVNTEKPDFLSHYDSSQFTVPKNDPRYNTEGDIYQCAKRGSQSLKDWRKRRELAQLNGSIQKSAKMSLFNQNSDVSIIKNASSAPSRYTTHMNASSVAHSNRSRLPIMEQREEILKVVSENNVCIIVGETGSGKTTQLTQFFYEDGYGRFGQIACTQPRRVAAVTVANRVASEMGSNVGDLVGYSIRFEDVTSDKTIIKYMTDGVMLRESLNDEDLSKYSVVIMDEAHERSLNTDILFGVLKRILSKRSDLKVIITSATMDSDKFSNYFGGAPVFHIKGRTFPVEPFFLRSNPEDYIYEAVRQVCSIHVKEKAGDILVFMTGREDIECTCELIREQLEKIEGVEPLAVLPIYSQLPAEQQALVFENMPIRKCVVATNIAETSLTIDGIRYVIDSGFSKQKSYSSKAGLDTLLTQPISQAASIQRMGRAGRTSSGKCWRLYSEMSFKYEMLPSAIPEIQRTNLANTILLLKSIGFNDVLSFDFMDKPPVDNFLHALNQLWSLRALTNTGALTKLGHDMVRFPLDPTLSKMVIVGNRFGCLEEILTIVSMLNVPPVFYKVKGKEEECESARQKFIVPESDHLTMLNVFNQWSSVGRDSVSTRERDQLRAHWAKTHFLNNMSLNKAAEVRRQLEDIAHEAGMKMSHVGPEKWDVVRRCICSAYFHHAAHLKNLSEYYNIQTGIACYIHPSSSLSGQSYIPEYIVYHELVLTSKHFLHGVTAIDPLWLSQMAPEFFTATDVFGKVLEEGKPTSDVDAEKEEWVPDEEKEISGDEEKEEVEEKPNFKLPMIPIHDDPQVNPVVLPPPVAVPRRRKRLG